MLSQLVCKRWYSLIQSVDTTINTVPTFPALMGPPSVGEHSSKRYTTVVDRKFIPHMPAVLLQIKFISKGHWTCRQSIPCVHMTLESQTSSPPPTPCPLPQLPFFISLSIFYGLTARERCEMVHEESWWHIFFFFFLLDMIFATCGRCEMIQDIRHGGISFLHWSWNFVPRYLVL